MKSSVKIFLSFFLICLFVGNLQGQVALKCLEISEIEENVEGQVEKGMSFPLVKVNSLLYIKDQDLPILGLTLEEEADCFLLLEKEQSTQRKDFSYKEIGEKMSSIAKPVYGGNIRSQLLYSKPHYYIPLEVLKGKWQWSQEEGKVLLKKVIPDYYLSHIVLKENEIKNNGEYWVNLIIKQGYWIEKKIIFEKYQYVLAPGESQKLVHGENSLYVGSQVQLINGLQIPLTQQIDFEQQIPFYEDYSKAQHLKQLEEVFPPFIIQGKMKYGLGDLKANENVSVIRAEKHAYYWVKGEHTPKQQVPTGSVQLLGVNWSPLPKVTSKMIEDFVTLSKVESQTSYLIWTDLYRQRTYVLEKQQGNWKHRHTFICSTGKNTNPTPAGFYEVQYAIPYFGMGKGYRCKNALVFFRDYMYHSILFDKTGQYIKSGQYELGSQSSHGCIRLSELDSRWLYQHIPVKTKVWIR